MQEMRKTPSETKELISRQNKENMEQFIDKNGQGLFK
jgi:hypothetical protein